MSEDILISGRLVAGHPMRLKPVMDDQNNPKMSKATSLPRQEIFMMVAIPKQGEADFKQTAWGQVLNRVASAAFINGEILRPDFAWKVIDGDSNIPNKRGRIPNTREGFPGHWVLTLKTETGMINSYHVGKYLPTDCIQDPNTIKTGDYCRVNVQVVDNKPAVSPGLYLNPTLFELSRAGEPIISGPDAQAVFGGGQPAQGGQTAPPTPPANGAATPAPPGAATPAPPAPPAQQTVRTLVATGQHSIESLRANNWSDEAIVANGHGRWEDVPVSSGVTPDPNFLNA